MTNQPTQKKSTDPSDIGPEELWLVWYSTMPLLQDLGEPPVKTNWVLAASGPKGLEALTGEKAYGDGLVAAFPLSVLQTMKDALLININNPKGRAGWARNALNIGKLMFVVDGQGNARIVSRNSELRPGEKQVLSGNRKDLLRMVNEGEEILSSKDWKKVFSDHRPFIKHGEVGWLDYQRSPEGAEMMRKFREGVPFDDL